MDRMEAIRLFVRLVECGSFSAVGRAMGIGQPAVSKQISALERHLGAQLVSRTSRQVVITEAGQTFYETARQLVDDFDALESSVGERQQSPRGVIRLSTAPAHGRLCITPLLPAFFRLYPDIAVEVAVSERQVDLVGEGIDLAIRHGRLVDSALTVRKLADADMVLVASPDYLAARGIPTAITDLDQHNCIVFSKRGERYPWAFGTGADAVSYLPRGSLMSGDAEHIRAAVLCGTGIAQAPSWLLADEVRTGHVHIVLPAWQPDRLPINLVHAAGRRLPMRVRLFVGYLLAAYREQGAS